MSDRQEAYLVVGLVVVEAMVVEAVAAKVELEAMVGSTEPLAGRAVATVEPRAADCCSHRSLGPPGTSESSRWR